MPCACKIEEHKRSFLSANYEHTFPNKNHQQCNAHEKHKQSCCSENYNRTRHAHARAASANSTFPQCSLQQSILILLIKTVRCSIPHCIYIYRILFYFLYL